MDELIADADRQAASGFGADPICGICDWRKSAHTVARWAEHELALREAAASREEVPTIPIAGRTSIRDPQLGDWGRHDPKLPDAEWEKPR